jgi:regulator of nonsense transcripts 1
MSGFSKEDDDEWENRSVTSEVTATTEVSALTNTFSNASVADTESDAGRDYSTAGSVYDEEEDYDHGEMVEPDHACKYCGIHDPKCVVQCITTGKWFCNGRGKTSSSHIVQHLLRSRNKEVRLHAESDMGNVTLECYQCQQRNVFLLGYVPSKVDSVVVLLCRDPCLNNGALKELNWDVSAWEPLISDKTFLPFLVRQPSEKAQLRARQLPQAALTALEVLWRTEPDATVYDLDRKIDEEGGTEMQPMQLRYDDGYEYQNILAPLIFHESEENKRLKSEKVITNIELRWEKSLGKNRMAVFAVEYFGFEDQDLRLNPGDEMILRLEEGTVIAHGVKPWESKGSVIRISEGEVYLELKSNRDVPLKITDAYCAEFVFKSTSYDRMQTALKTFAVDDTSVSGYLYHKLLGHEVQPQKLKVDLADNLSVPNLPPLNEPQAEAVRSVLERPLSLIQGPPGTGKTLTSASIVYHLSKQNQGKGNGHGQVLVCAPSNVAVDQLTEKIHKTGLRVVRLAAKSREAEGESSPTVEPLTLHNMVRFNEGQHASMLRKFQLLKDETGELTAADAKKYRNLVRLIEKEILSAADVICCTCVGAGDPRLKEIRFRQLLIDESTQSMEAECLIPIVMGVKQLVLVGDHCQLGPVVLDKKAARAGLDKSLFDRLLLLGHRPQMLKVQYRMHPTIAQWPSNTFYDGMLQNGVEINERVLNDVELPWLDPENPLFFMCCDGHEEMASSGTSYLNRAEATLVEKIATLMMKGGVEPREIGMITPYQGQRAQIITHMTNYGSMKSGLYEEIEVASVDSFQGREKDFIILSCVRSNENQGIGFLRDPRRLNVALTRARYGVIIIGNARLLSKNPLWNNLLHHLQERDGLMDSSFPRLSLSNLRLPQLRASNGNGNGGSGGGGYHMGANDHDQHHQQHGANNHSGGNEGQRSGMGAFGQDLNQDYARHWGDSVQETRAGYGAGALGDKVYSYGGSQQQQQQQGGNGGYGGPRGAGSRFDSRHDKHYANDNASFSDSSFNTQSRSLRSGLPADTDKSAH